MRQSAVPLSSIYLIVAKPIISPTPVLDSILKCPNVGVYVALNLVPQSTKMAIVINAFENRPIIENGNRQSVELVFFFIFITSFIFRLG
jgi:hypothetical protein